MYDEKILLQVVLASTPDMECGFSRELFLQWAPKAANSIIITNRYSIFKNALTRKTCTSSTSLHLPLIVRSPPGTLARQLLEMNDSNKTVQLLVKRRVRLEGAELQEYQKKEKQETTNKMKSSSE